MDEHDFYQGKYRAETADADDEGNGEEDAAPPVEAPKIKVEVAIANLSLEQQARFGGQVEWLKTSTGDFYDEPDPAGVDAADIVAALRVTFIGEYDADEDDFIGNTYFTRTLSEEETPTPISKKDKQHCGFLFLRLSCCRFDGHRDWVFHEAGGRPCRDESSAENSRSRRSSLSENAGCQ